MAQDNVTTQSDWVEPPKNGECLVFTVDSTSREYDLSGVNFGTDFQQKASAVFYVDASADGGAVYITFSATSGKTVDDTAAITAGGTVAFTANACNVIWASTTKPFYYDRTQHRYMQVKCANGASAKLRLNVSSTLRPGDKW